LPKERDKSRTNKQQVRKMEGLLLHKSKINLQRKYSTVQLNKASREPHKRWLITSLKEAMAGTNHLTETMKAEIMGEMVDIRNIVFLAMMIMMMTLPVLAGLLQLMEIAIVSNLKIELKIWRRGLKSWKMISKILTCSLTTCLMSWTS